MVAERAKKTEPLIIIEYKRQLYAGYRGVLLPESESIMQKKEQRVFKSNIDNLIKEGSELMQIQHIYYLYLRLDEIEQLLATAKRHREENREIIVTHLNLRKQEILDEIAEFHAQ